MTIEERAEKALADLYGNKGQYRGPAVAKIVILEEIEAAIAEEREACAKIAEETAGVNYGADAELTAMAIAEAIRKRKEAQ